MTNDHSIWPRAPRGGCALEVGFAPEARHSIKNHGKGGSCFSVESWLSLLERSVACRSGGIETCGKRETNDATKIHESCCRLLPLPTTTSVRLDKYEATAGRVTPIHRDGRTESWQMGGGRNRRQLVNRPAARLGRPRVGRNLLPASANPSHPMNLVLQVGGTVMDMRYPSALQGCFNSTGAYGSNLTIGTRPR